MIRVRHRHEPRADTRSRAQDPLHVVMLIQHYLPTLGGAERQLAALVPLLSARGVRVTVITRTEQPMLRDVEMGGARVLRVRVRGPAPLRSLHYTAAAVRAVRRLHPDVLHAHDMLSPTTSALLGSQLTGAAVVVKVLRSGPVGDLARLRQKSFGRRRIGWMRRAVARFIVISDDIGRELSETGFAPDQQVLVPNGVDLVRFRPITELERGRRRRELGWGSGPVALFSGRLAPEKRVDRLVAAWPRIRERVPDAQLVVVGSGPLQDRLHAAAGPGVVLIGALDDVAQVVPAADVFVLPSIAEGLSNSMLEAMASGLGVVATRVGGAADLIVDGANGSLVEVDDHEALEDAIVELLADARRCRTYGFMARRVVADRFSLETTADALVRLYRSVSER